MSAGGRIEGGGCPHRREWDSISMDHISASCAAVRDHLEQVITVTEGRQFRMIFFPQV